MAKRKVDELDNTEIIEKTRSKGIESSNNVALREETCKQISRYFYINVVPLKVAESEGFQKMCNHFGGPTFKPLSYMYLKQEVAEIKESIKDHKAMWKKTSEGVTICNFFVNCPKGTVFLRSVNASDMCKTVDDIFKMIYDVVEEVGKENVVQVGMNLTIKLLRNYWWRKGRDFFGCLVLLTTLL
ncbi:hypothetical protein GmHk_14G040492 [Glycine max]|nr:hypothetical protein GmHk_14G040492 [Glycine max]